LPQLTKILVVDDFEPFRRFARSLLQQMAVFEVAEAADGLEAVQKAKELNPELILLDIGLPRLNGIEVAERVQSFAPTTKILFCSQESSPDVVREALTLGFGYVHKLEAGIDLLPAFKAVLSGRRFVSSNLELDHAIAVRAPRHEILFCSDDTAILDGLTRFIAAALKGGNASIVWATESHRGNLLQSLRQHGVDVDAAIRQGTYIAADVSEPPDAARIVASINALREAAAKTGNTRPRVAVATALSEMREPVRTTQQVLGHSSPHTTLAFYTQSVEDSQRAAISKLERILFPNVPKFEEGPSLIH